EQNPPGANLLIPRQGFVEKIEKVIMQGNDPLQELDVLHQPDQIIGEDLMAGHGSHTARVEGRRVRMTAFHQAKHLTSQSAHLQSLAIKLPAERVKRAQNVGGPAEAMDFSPP